MGRKQARRHGNRTPGGGGENIFKDGENRYLSASRQIDEFDYSGNMIIPPPYEPAELIALIERHDGIRQLVTAFAANAANFGAGAVWKEDFDYSIAGEDVKAAADAEWAAVSDFIKNAHPLADFSEIIYKAAFDMHAFGWGLTEVIRDGAGRVCGLEYCRACNFRIVHNDGAESEVDTPRGKAAVKFKKFVQQAGGKLVYFKEFGDRRVMNCETGDYYDLTPPEKRATELAYLSIHAPYTDYGVPHWINAHMAACGSVMSERLNFKYFQDGRHLPSALIVSGGQLTEESIHSLEHGTGLKNAYKILVLEALPDEKDENVFGGNSGNVKIDVKDLTGHNNSDALFREYQKDGREKARDSMRLPPIYTGAAADYTRATADTARAMAEEQIFIPERRRICGVFNKVLGIEWNLTYCEIGLKGADVSDMEQRAKLLDALNAAGAVTPNMLTEMTEELTGRTVEPWAGDSGNVPFELIKMEKAAGAGTENVSLEKSGDIDDFARLVSELRKEVDGE